LIKLNRSAELRWLTEGFSDHEAADLVRLASALK
jgi:hypothetical protein